jgi:high affinity Mn2+ porin
MIGHRGASAATRFALSAILVASVVPAAAQTPVDQNAPAPDGRWPQLLGAQFTGVLQHQSSLDSPYSGPLSLLADGDTQPSETFGFYAGWAITDWAQYYFDTEKFMGAGVSHATGLGGLTNGDVVREGANNLSKRFYVARNYLRLMLPLAPGTTRVERAQDQIAGTEAATRLEFKYGLMAVNDDFDKNRYAGSTRTEFMNWSLWNNTAWDFAANTRGYTDGFVLSYISPTWALRYGEYLMPKFANGQPLEPSWVREHGQNLELTLSPWAAGTVLRVLAYQNKAHMGDYQQALAIAAISAGTPDVIATEQDGRKKTGFGVNAEQPLADSGDTGVFVRLGWNDGKTESFAFTEVDRLVTMGGELSGAHWSRGEDRLGVGIALNGLSAPHREYLAAGGAGFLLDDGRLNYATEEIFETYYRLQLPDIAGKLRLQLSPDFQYIRNPGFNHDRGPVSFAALRFHVEY